MSGLAEHLGYSTGNATAAEAAPKPVAQEPVAWELDADTAKFLSDLILGNDEPTPITLSVGFVQNDDGSIQHGLRVHETEYPEEGVSLLIESPLLRPQPDLAAAQSYRDDLEANYAALKAELAAARKDAGRYRWLRDHDNDLWIAMIEAIKIGGETMEAAIDKEMAKCSTS